LVGCVSLVAAFRLGLWRLTANGCVSAWLLWLGIRKCRQQHDGCTE